MEGLEAGQLAILVVVLSVAYFVRGLAGFGSGLIAIPVLTVFVPLDVAVPLVVTLDYLASAGQGSSNRQHIRWREIHILIVPGLCGVLAGLWLFHLVPTEYLVKALAIFIFLYAIYALVGPKLPPASRIWALPAGFFGGGVGTLFGTGGPFYVTYLKARGLEKESFRATFATVFVIDGAARLAGYAGSGFFDMNMLKMLVVAVPVMVVGMWLGGHMHTTVSQQSFQRLISLLLIGSSISLMVK